MLSKLQFTNKGEEDEWGDFVSSPNKYGGSFGNSTIKIENGGGLKVGPTKKGDAFDEWGVFYSSSIGNGTSNFNLSTENLGKKHENGTSTHKEEKEQDWSFFFSSSVSPQLNETPINSEISTQKIQNGVLHVVPTQSNNWASFTTHQISNRNFENGTKPTILNEISNKKLENVKLQVGPNKKRDGYFEEENWGAFDLNPVAITNGTKPVIFHEISHQKLENVKLHVGPRDRYFEEEEWGEFVSSPVGSGTKNGTSCTSVKWEKPKGPLPLSFFGGQEDQESVQENEIKIKSLETSVSELIDSDSGSKGLKLNEMIVNLYGGSELNDASSSKIAVNGLGKEASITSSSSVTEQHILQELSFDQGPVLSKESISIAQRNEGEFEKTRIKRMQVMKRFGSLKMHLLDQKTSTQTQETNLDDWSSFASSNEKLIGSSSEMKSVIETDQSTIGTSGTSESAMKNFVLEFYWKLREGSLFLICRHLQGLKEASKVAAFSGQADEEKKLNEKMQETYRELKKLKLSNDLNLEVYSSNDTCINDLLNSIGNSHLKAFEQEYQLSTKLFLALDELSPAIVLLKHSLITLNALENASIDDMNAYISTWSRIISVCAQELQNGAIVWAEMLKENMSHKIISIGGNYFIGLGEIYRVSEVLKLTLKYFNSWLLISNQTDSSEIGANLEVCTKSWKSGLGNALERVSNRDSKFLAKSIKRILEMNFEERFFEDQDLYLEYLFCKICLFPLASFTGMRGITWNGDKYFVKFANLWINKISWDPPSLPNLKLGWGLDAK